MACDLSKVRTCVLWDIEDFQVHDGEKVESIYLNIDAALTDVGYQNCGMSELMIYGEKNKIWDEFILAGIMVVPIGDKCARVRRMIRDILVWALNNPSDHHIPQNVMIISKDIFKDTEFLSLLLGLETRVYNILLVEEDSDDVASLNQLPFVSSVWLWKTLLAGGRPFEDDQCGNKLKKSISSPTADSEASMEEQS